MLKFNRIETGTIKTLAIQKSVVDESKSPKMFVDARKLLSREQIDDAKIAVLFVELGSDKTVH